MICSLTFTLGGCTNPIADDESEQTIPTSNSSPLRPTTQSAAVRESFYSAARPCIPQQEGSYLPIDTQTLLSAAERVFNAKPLFETVVQSEQQQSLLAITLPDYPQIAVRYLASYDLRSVPVMVAQFGYGVNTIDAFGILWYEDGVWKSQPYPQAAPEIAQQRNQVLSPSKFCSGLVIEMYQRRNLIAVVNDLGRRGTHPAQEVHLLEFDGETWKVAWVPTYEKWQTIWHSIVEFQDGIDSFIVHRAEKDNLEHRWQEVWERQGTQYVKVETTSSSL